MATLITVAHRAGNSLPALRAALAADVALVEADVHAYRRVLEVRHRKWLGPAHLWDRGELVRRRDVEVPLLPALLAAAGPGHAGRLMLDLKGLHPGLAPAVAAALRAAAPGAPVVVCTRHWWMLRAFRADPHVRLMMSAGSRRGLARLRAAVRARRPAGPAAPAAPAAPHPYGVCVRRDLLTPAVVAELAAAGPHVLTWPVDTDAELGEARRLGVGGVIGKSLPVLRQAAGDPTG